MKVWRTKLCPPSPLPERLELAFIKSMPRRCNARPFRAGRFLSPQNLCGHVLSSFYRQGDWASEKCPTLLPYSKKVLEHMQGRLGIVFSFLFFFLLKNGGTRKGKDYEIPDSLPVGAMPRGMPSLTHSFFSIQDIGTHFLFEMQSTLRQRSFWCLGRDFSLYLWCSTYHQWVFYLMYTYIFYYAIVTFLSHI